MSTGRRLGLAACALAGVLSARTAAAAPTVITTPPELDAGKLSFLIGGLDESGRSLKTSTLDLAIDGNPAGSPALQPFADWAASSAEASATWRPPFAVGLVYLWIDGVPSGVLDGIHAFFQRIPSRTVVYPTIYGRLRQGRARLTAGDISRLDEVPYLDGYRPNMIEAIRLNLADLAADPAPLKILLLVTDGRDFADPKGDAPGSFAEIGAQLRRAGVTTLVVGYRPEADAEQAAANLRDLQEAAGGFLSTRDQADDLENTLESLGQGVADLQRVEVERPWTWRLFGGSHRLSVHLTSSRGERLTADLGAVSAPGSDGLRWLSVLLLGSAALIAGVAIFKARGRSAPAPAARIDTVVAAAHDLIRRGASPSRAVEELNRRFPGASEMLAEMDDALLTDPRFPYLRTRPGRKRMMEIREIVHHRKTDDHPALAGALVRILAEAASGQLSPEEAARSLSAHTSSEEREAFVALDMDKLASTLRAFAGANPVLGTPRARGIAVSVQDALRAGEDQKFGVSLAWLVRAGGPGRRGETLRLDGSPIVIGRGPGCGLRITTDPSMAPEHAEISVEDGEYAIAPIGGPVKIEGQDVTGRQALVDGETIDLGGGIYVFKSASVRSLTGNHRTGRYSNPA
ncbi:MAG TPA: FHA domain-containing protein [Polyangia bacterium]|nr:FHA domain-containing protein [Polyangia bacterium]